MKENAGAQRKGGYAAALRAKQAVGAEGDAAAAAPLPRVAVLSSHSRLASHPIRSPLLSSLSDRPLSSHKGRAARSQQTAASQRVGCRPATHSQRLVPLADAAARAPAGTAASSRPARQPSVSSSVVIGDPGLDAAEEALQAELAATDRQLERLLRQSQQRRVPTPEPAPPAATRAAIVPAVVLGVPAAAVLSPASVLQPAVRQPSPDPQAVPSPVLEPLQEQQQEQELAIPPQDHSIVRSVVTATGTGCKDIIAQHTGAALQPGACWTSRGHRTLRLESSAILQLWGRTNADVTLRITFADAASVPRIVRLEHAPTPTAAFERLGDIRLQAKSLTQLKHLFRLGKNLEVQRCLRITLLGHMAEEDSGAHRVTHMLLTSSLGPQRSGSALSHATFAAPDPLSARSAQASVNHAPGQQQHLDFITPRDQATPDSGAALPPPLSAHSAAPAPAAAAQAAAAPDPASEARPQSSSSSQPRVPPLPLASILSGGSSASASRGPAPSAQPSQPQPAPEEEPASASQAPSGAAESGGTPATECSAGIPAQQVQSIRAELDFLLLAEEFAAATQAQQEVEQQGEGQQEDQEQQGEEQGGAVPGAEVSAPASQATDRLRASTAASLMLLPAQRCSAVAATLSKLQLSPEQAKRAVLQLLDLYGSAADEHADDLLACLPSHEERAVLARYDGPPDALSHSEQFMLEMMAVPVLDARVEAWRFADRFAGRADALGATAALLAGACGEVQRSELLRTLLKVALLAGSFLNAGNKDGAASGFQVDALLRLKDVRSTRARSRTLLHFVAREVVRQHPDGASLAAELPSAAAAAQLDLGAAVAELEGLAVEAREVQAALAAGGSNCAAPLATFEAAVAERLAALQAQMDEAQAAFKQLGTVINGQRATLAEPAAFFGILHDFADELDAAHEENAEADAAADAASSARKSRRTGAGGSPTASAAVSEASRRSSRRSHTPENVRGSVTSVRSVGQTSSLQRLKHVAAEQRRSTASAAPAASAASQPRHPQHSPQPCLSQAAVASLGGSCRSAMGASSPPPASSAVAVSSLLGVGVAAGGRQGTPQDLGASQEQQQAQAQAQAGSKLSTPVEELLKESARIISSIDLGDRDGGGGGFGSAIIASEAAVASSAAVGDTAGTPDGAVVSVAVDSDAGFTTPRHELGRSQPNASAAAPLVGTIPLRYAAGGSAGDEVPAAARAAAAAGAPLGVDRSIAGASSNALNMSQMRQRSLQHLSPTSTPLSSLGRQSSRSSVVSSDAGGSTPASGKHARGSALRHSASPLGAAQQAQQAGHVAATSAEAGPVAGRGTAAGHVLCFPELPAGREASPAAEAAARAAQQAQLQASYRASPTADMYAYSSDEEESPAAAASRAAAAEAEAAEVLAAARPPTGFGALHSRASSCDLTFYAPFTLHQMGQSQEMQQGLGSSFEAIVSAGSGSAWAPLAATQQRRLSASAGGLRHVATIDAATLQRDAAAAAASMQGLPHRAAVSMPASPRGGVRARPPQPLNLGSVAGRLQLHQRAVGRQAQSQQLSPVLEALLDSVPTPYAAPAASAQQQGQRAEQEELAATPAAELTAGDLVDLANCTSDHEAEWAALEEMEVADREQQQQLAAERERRELAMLQALLPPPAAHAAQREPTPEWAAAYPREQLHSWLAAQQAAVAASAEQRPQQGEEDDVDQEPQQLQQASLMVQVPGQEQAGAEAGGALAAPLFQQLPPLPSPITTTTVNLDATLARLLASAGNTPSGPLGKAAGRWEAVGGGAAEDGPHLEDQGQAVFLLEPMLPAPLGEGVRASERMAEGIPPAALRSSIECLKASMRPGSAAGLRRSGSAPPTSLSMEAAAWAAQQAQEAAVQRQGSLDPAPAAAYGGEWDGGVGLAQRRDHLRGLRKLLSRGRQH